MRTFLNRVSAIALAGGCLAWTEVHADLLVSEFLASNSGASLVDEDAEGSDWLEIRNTGTEAVSLEGYRLTDDAVDLAKWVFPGVSVPAGGYLVVFASGKDRSPVSGELHTNFKLSASGEYLALVDPLGVVTDSFDPVFPAQEEDISYGKGPDGVTTGYFISPTPGAANVIPSEGRVADTVFSVTRGIFDVTFSLEIYCETEGATIHYTTDGSAPSESNGTDYENPIPINGTTVVRAIAFKAGLFPTNVDTHSYLFPSDVRTQFANGSAPSGWPNSSVNGQVYDYGMDPDITDRYSAAEMEDALTAIPSVMITTDVGNLTDADNGIYSNPLEHGIDWERPANVEFIGNPDLEPVSARCGLRVRGGASRAASNPKHAFRLFFRDDYGDSRLESPIFEEEGTEEFKKIDFRTAQNYSWSKDGDVNENTFLREVLARDIQGASGQPYTRSRYHHLYLNGVYWGLFMSQERSEANFGESYLGGDSDDFDALKSAGREVGYYTEATDGELTGDWEDLWLLSRTQRTNPTLTRYREMQGLDASGVRDPSKPVLLDVDNLIDYMMVIGYAGAYDNSLSSFVGASNNWYSVRNRVRDDRGFVHFMHDGEHSLGAGGGRWNSHNDRINTDNGINRWDEFDRSNPQFLHMDLAANTEEYRMRFADRARAALFNGGYLTRDRIFEMLERRKTVVEQVIIAESARWGDSKRDDPGDKEHWIGAVEGLESTLESRAGVFLGHLRAGGLYPDVDAPDFTPFERYISPGASVGVSASGGTIYYTTDGSDPRLAGGAVNESAQTLPTLPSAVVVARGSDWNFDDAGTNRGSSEIVAGEAGWGSNNWKHPDFNDGGWSDGPGILGYGQLDQDNSAVSTPMGEETAPGDANPTTCYLRHTFSVADPLSVTGIQAEVLADDGVVIYLNGTEVHRQNLPDGEIESSTFALSAVANAGELTYHSFSVDPDILVTGDNVIAVELHQVNATSSDLGFDLSMTLPAAQALVISSPTKLNARILDGGEWSAMTSNYFSTGNEPGIGGLVFSEVNYHPANPSTEAELEVTTRDEDFEYVELANLTGGDLELMGVSLAEQVISDHLEGVRFVFEEGFVLPPGGKAVVVADLEAFRARYPLVPEEVIAGEFGGSLGNSGEWLRLMGPDGTILSSFRYNDVAPWPEEADGGGPSMQLSELSSLDPADGNSWIASYGSGTPGEAGPGLFSGDPSGDVDMNGQSDLLDYFIGEENGGRSCWMDPISGHLIYRFIRDPEAIGVSWVLEETASPSSGWTDRSPNLVERRMLPNGLVEETHDLGLMTGPRKFVRQRVTLAP